jgi:hypothetical protein
VGDEVHPFFRHTIDAPQVTPIRHRKAEVIDDSVFPYGRRFITHGISSFFYKFDGAKSRIPPWFVIPANPGSGPGQAPESSSFKYLQNIWTPVFTGVTVFCETVRVETKSSKPYTNKYMSRNAKIKHNCSGV